MEKRKRSVSPTQWHCLSLLGLKEGSGYTVSPSQKYKLLGDRKLPKDALQEASSSSDRSLSWRVFTWFLYCATTLSHVCARLHTCAHTVLETILKSRRRDHLGSWFATNTYHPARWKVHQSIQKVRTGCLAERHHQLG